MLLSMLWLAAEAPSGGTDPGAAVQVALIGAIAPVVLVIINEIFKRWRSRGTATEEPREGVLAPVDEVPRAQFEQLLERVADMDDRAHDREKAHEQDRTRWLLERRELEVEIDRQRRDMMVEVERRVRAETMLQAMQGGGPRG